MNVCEEEEEEEMGLGWVGYIPSIHPSVPIGK